MLDTKYGLNYSMPHTVVHIVDNSMYQGELPTVVVDDPSLYATLVVTGCPMGADNVIVPINRSDVLNVAYGMANLSAGDIQKYGQTITYPTALINQDAPIKFMRVTPSDATYAFSCLLVQWRWDGSKLHVRFKTTSGDTNNGLPIGYVHSNFKTTEKLHEALVRGFRNDAVINEEDGGSPWTQRVFMTTIAAGRGKVYNYYNYAINQTQQSKRPANVRYLFTSIDTRIGQTVERFYGSLINENNGMRADAVQTVNVQVASRVKGSSILVPTINEAVVHELYNVYMNHMKEMIDAGILPDTAASMKFVSDVYATMNVNIFDPIYGKYIYNGDSDVQLPYFQVDMFNLDIPQLDTANRVNIVLDDSTSIADYVDNPTDFINILKSASYGISNGTNAYHVGNVYLANANTTMLNMITSINQYTGAVTSIPISQVYTDDEKTKKDLFKGYVTVLSDEPTLDAVIAGALELISRKKLTPRVNPDTSASATKTSYIPDYLFVGYANGTKFAIAKIAYQDREKGTELAIDTANSKLYTTKEDLYTLFVYPDTTVTAFATTSTENNWNLPGSTLIDVDGELGTVGAVYVNDYTVSSADPTSTDNRDAVNCEEPFIIGVCPTSIPGIKDIMNTYYDCIIYKTDGTGVYTWTITGGAVDEESTPSGYKVGDIVSIANESGTALATYEITSITELLSGKQLIEINYISGFASENTAIKAGSYAATGGNGEGLKILVSNDAIKVKVPASATPAYIQRYFISGTQGSIYRYALDPTLIPANYYSPAYGINPNSELGGIPIEHGYAGFFDDDISDIEFKWRYSELLVKAYRGQIDPRIQSPVRCPAKYLFDGATNTIVGQTILPYMTYQPIDIINASTIYTADEKEAIQLDQSLISNIKEFADIDVKQAMYDLTEYRCYYGIPEDKRPMGPGSGLSLHLDSGIVDANTAMLINASFTKRFNNPNVSWDIGGYKSSVDGILYTYSKRLVDNMIGHLKRYTVNKPYVGKYTNISPDEYVSFFPDIDTADWELRELLYNSGGNSWIMDVNGNLQRKSQRTLYRENDTSDIIQENNMRTLSQLVYMLQNKIDTYLLEYNDDGVLKTLKDDVDNMFTNWVGNLVQALDITFKRDINPKDGGEIVVCYCNVKFRGLILRVPIIVNVQRRNDSE